MVRHGQATDRPRHNVTVRHHHGLCHTRHHNLPHLRQWQQSLRQRQQSLRQRQQSLRQRQMACLDIAHTRHSRVMARPPHKITVVVGILIRRITLSIRTARVPITLIRGPRRTICSSITTCSSRPLAVATPMVRHGQATDRLRHKATVHRRVMVRHKAMALRQTTDTSGLAPGTKVSLLQKSLTMTPCRSMIAAPMIAPC